MERFHWVRVRRLPPIVAHIGLKYKKVAVIIPAVVIMSLGNSHFLLLLPGATHPPSVLSGLDCDVLVTSQSREVAF